MANGIFVPPPPRKEQALRDTLRKMNSSEENYANFHKNNKKMQREPLDTEAVIDSFRKTNTTQLKEVSNLSEQLKISNMKNQQYEKNKEQLETDIRNSWSKLGSLKKEHEEYLSKYNDLMEKYKNQEELSEQIKNQSNEKDKSLSDANRKLNDLK